MNEAKQQRPLELINPDLCLDYSKGWFIQTTFSYPLTLEIKMSSLSGPCLTADRPAPPGGDGTPSSEPEWFPVQPW